MDGWGEVCVDFGCEIVVVEFGVGLCVGVKVFGWYYVVGGYDVY